MLKQLTSIEKSLFKGLTFEVDPDDKVDIFLKKDWVATVDLVSNNLKLKQNRQKFKRVNKLLLKNQKVFILLARTYFVGFNNGALMYCYE